VTAILVLGLGGVKMSELISGTPLAMRMRCLVETMIQLGSTRLRHFLWVSALALLSGGRRVAMGGLSGICYPRGFPTSP